MGDNVTQFTLNVTLKLSEGKSNSLKKKLYISAFVSGDMRKGSRFWTPLTKSLLSAHITSVSHGKKMFWNSLIWNQKAR
jgi:hypothetical protein